jgi:hypothetical protein
MARLAGPHLDPEDMVALGAATGHLHTLASSHPPAEELALKPAKGCNPHLIALPVLTVTAAGNLCS